MKLEVSHRKPWGVWWPHRPVLFNVQPLSESLLESAYQHDFFHRCHVFLGEKLSLDCTVNSLLPPSGFIAQIPLQLTVLWEYLSRLVHPFYVDRAQVSLNTADIHKRGQERTVRMLLKLREEQCRLHSGSRTLDQDLEKAYDHLTGISIQAFSSGRRPRSRTRALLGDCIAWDAVSQDTGGSSRGEECPSFPAVAAAPTTQKQWAEGKHKHAWIYIWSQFKAARICHTWIQNKLKHNS